MIGVIAKPEQLDVVEEFFQLFKTPWEYYRPESAYSVVIATSSDISNVKAKLLVVYGPDVSPQSFPTDLVTGGRLQSSCLSYRGMSIPIYGEARGFADSGHGNAVVMAGTETAGVKMTRSGATVIRLGYDLFEEVKLLLTTAQPLEFAHIPTLDAHINMLRNWILEEQIPLMEIPPVPAGYRFAVCLTHDIDFIGIRQHKFDHTMLGFLYRSTFGALRNLIRGRINLQRLFASWWAAASLPLVYLGWAKDFWDPFDWYLKAEQNLPATYFLIPFKRRVGEHVSSPHASRRATAYDVRDIGDQAATLRQQGCELGVHGIDAWHSADKGRAELQRVSQSTSQSCTGIRMHWLLQDSGTFAALEEAGFVYDSTAGYNETVGYRNGTTQVFRPLGARTLLELPMHIQDGALLFHNRLDLSESQAHDRCLSLINNAANYGGVLTLLWHDRSHGPERFWGDFYLSLLQQLKSLKVWFGSGAEVVDWFQKRREVRFERVETPDGVRARVCYDAREVQPALRARVYSPGQDTGNSTFVDIAWDRECAERVDRAISRQSPAAFQTPVLS